MSEINQFVKSVKLYCAAGKEIQLIWVFWHLDQPVEELGRRGQD